MNWRRLGFVVVVLPFIPIFLHAEATRVQIASRRDILSGQSFGSAGPYEYLSGRIFFSIDPANSNNQVITDLDKAPRNAAGHVEFSADLGILRPKDKARGNGFALVDIPNRGGVYALRFFNMGIDRVGQAALSDSINPAEIGDGFLLRQGYTIVFVGWEFDILNGPGRAPGYGMRIEVPGATGITGMARATLIPDARTRIGRFVDLAGYSPKDPSSPDNTLTVRDRLTDAPITVARNKWQLAGNNVTLSDGFEAGRIYELSFVAAEPAISGLGFASIRDTASWIKYHATAEAASRYTIAYGISQTGRFLNDFIYLGFNTDERDRQAFDGVMNQIAGVSRTDVNQRWSIPFSLLMFSTTSFPFSPASQRDRVTGSEDGLVENARAHNHIPKIFYTNTDVEYWGGGRAAALLHTTPDGSEDIALPGFARAYLFAGTQHGLAPFPSRISNGQQKDNPNDYRWSLRALLVALQQWVSQNTAPPASRIPRFQDKTLARIADVAFPPIPGVKSPASITAGSRVGNSLLPKNGAPGTPLPLVVPQVDADGNDLGGIRLPEVAVPLATYTGWNFRNTSIGGVDQLYPLLGSYIPFARTADERMKNGDPRLSIAERYPRKEDYLAKVQQVSSTLVNERYLLAEDVPAVVRHAENHWNLLVPPPLPASLAFTTLPQFQTVSIKPNDSGSPDSSAALGNGRFSVTNGTLRQQIVRAYQIDDAQITGGPDWVSIDRFDIDAAGPATTNLPQTRLMLRALLADRFQLQFHRELRGNVEMFVIDQAERPKPN